VNILFCVTNFGFLRNFQSTIASLAERGHRLHLVADRGDRTGGMTMVADLVARFPTITYEISTPARRDPWHAFTGAVRLTLDYWRYLEPRFADAVQLRARAERQAPFLARTLVRLPLLRTVAGRRLLFRLVRSIERTIPIRAEVRALLHRQSPDVLLLTPLLYFGSRQVEHVRAARELGIPSLLGVGSWDHLTTKGLIHELPDHVAVWNEMQKAEAIDLHAVPAARVIVTGAQAYDHWFERQPGSTRPEFCRRTGLADNRPFLLYVCSSPFITPHEVPFVTRWIEAIRTSRTPELRTVGLLIRPHPQNAEQWAEVDLSRFGNVAIWPRAGANPIDDSAKSDYFDSIFHSHAVVGINTSALIESGIIGRRVYSIRVDEFAATQEGTLHFQHLKNVEGGLLQLAASLDEHLAQVAPTLESRVASGDDRKVRGFVGAFVRPHGLDVPATPRIVDMVERVGQAGRRPPVRASGLVVAGRGLVTPIALAMMVASIERDRWRSGLLRAARPFRLAARAVRRRATAWWRSVRRAGRTALAAASPHASVGAGQERTRHKTELRDRKHREKRKRQRRKQLDVLRERIMRTLGRA
jgi:hypothetical protein